MASPRTRRVLSDLKPKDENNVSVGDDNEDDEESQPVSAVSLYSPIALFTFT